MVGVARWLHGVWAAVTNPPTLVERPDANDAREVRRLVHETGLRVTRDIGGFQFNTMLAALMELTNQLQRLRDAGEIDRTAWHEATERLVLMLAPACPHLAEELWERLGMAYSVHLQ